MYLNPNWTEDMYAETSFYQFDKETLERIEQMSYDKVDREGLESYDLLGMLVTLTFLFKIALCWSFARNIHRECTRYFLFSKHLPREPFLRIGQVR